MDRNDNQIEQPPSGSMDPQDPVRPETNEASEREVQPRRILADAPPGGIDRRRAERRRIERLSTDL
jgi:hypothetical protein